MKGCNQSVVWWYTHLITDSVLAVHVTMVLICNLKKMKVFSRHWVSFFCVPALSPTCFRYIFCNHFVFENATNFCFLTMLLEKQIQKNTKYFLCYWRKKEKTLDPDGRIPLKLVYRVDRAASQQTLQEKVFEETHHCNKEWSYLKVYNQKRHWLAEMNTEQSCRRGKEHVLQHSSVQLWNPPKHVYSCTRTSDSSFRLSVCTKFTLKSPARSYNTL